MIQVSELAAMALFETLQEILASSDEGLRLSRKNGRLTLKLDKPGPYDQIIRHQNRILLIIDHYTGNEIEEGTIDAENDTDDPHLVLRRTNKKQHNDITLE